MHGSMLLLALLSVGCTTGGAGPSKRLGHMDNTMNGAESPKGERHPGTIEHDDKIEGRVWTRRADEVPPTIAWVQLDGKWIPVIRIEITGTPDRREITKYGPGGQMLETTVQARWP